MNKVFEKYEITADKDMNYELLAFLNKKMKSKQSGKHI